MKHSLLVLLLTGFCIAGERGRAWQPKVPRNFRELNNAVSSDPDAARAGARLFQRYCASCHGPHAGGIGKAPALRSPVVREAPPGALFWLLRNGILRRGMPSWSHLPAGQRWQIITWLKTIQ